MKILFLSFFCIAALATTTKVLLPKKNVKAKSNEFNNALYKKSADNKLVNEINYDSCKQQIIEIKKVNRIGWSKKNIEEKEKIFTNAVVETIIPAWIGTPWDFNGITQTPGKGKIACGYFVTTVMRDAGVQLERVKLAQAASQNIIRALAQKKDIKLSCNKPIGDFINLIRQNGYGLYVVGLDNHTGFIYNDGIKIFLYIHL